MVYLKVVKNSKVYEILHSLLKNDFKWKKLGKLIMMTIILYILPILELCGLC